MAGHRPVACREYDWEAMKIGAGPPPIRVPEGWLLIHHGVSGVEVEGWGPQQHLVLRGRRDAARPGRPRPRARPHPASRCSSRSKPRSDRGIVPNVVFPTAIEEIDGQRFVFYGMADSSIGVARLEVAS